MKPEIADKKIVLGVCGGIAAYKSAELLRGLKKRGASVRVVMTKNATRFVGEMTFEALSGLDVCTSLFERSSNASIRHIDWAREADLVVVAPATANMIGKLAGAIADDALSTFILAVTCPIIICPSMNTHMYENRAVQRNLDQLEADGYQILEPGAGELACGTTGPGRLPEPDTIVDRIVCTLAPKDFSGKRVLVTAGPTQEFFDPVRFISNPSTGKMGFAIARAAEYRGASVVLVTGPTHLPDPVNVRVIRVQSAGQMAAEVFAQVEQADIVIKSAAVSDYKPRQVHDHKMKKDKDEMVIELDKNPDILKALGEKKENRILVGFAAETQDLKDNAAKKLSEKNLDLIVGNIVGKKGSGFGADTNIVTLFHRGGMEESLPVMDKDDVAHTLLDRIRDFRKAKS